MLALLLALLQLPAHDQSGTFGLPSQPVVGVINIERAANAVNALAPDPCLDAVATARAQDMVRENYFSHVAPNGGMAWDLMRERGCDFHYAGENIAEAWNSRQALDALWGSPEHRANTLDVHYARVGIGVATRPDGTIVFVEDFSD